VCANYNVQTTRVGSLKGEMRSEPLTALIACALFSVIISNWIL